MENFDWQFLLKDYKLCYYTSPLMMVLSLAVVIKGLALKQKNRFTYTLIIYSGASLLQSALFHLEYIKPNVPFEGVLTKQSASVFITIEVTCCYLLINPISISRIQKRITLLLLLAFYIFEIWHLYPIFFTKYNNDTESFVELPILIIFCSFYYYQLFVRQPHRNLKNSPLFWAIAGFTLLAFLQIPYNIIYAYVAGIKSGLQVPMIINFISYSLLFVCFLKAVHLTNENEIHV